jgi:ferritin-like metal-binding protein YciE
LLQSYFQLNDWNNFEIKNMEDYNQTIPSLHYLLDYDARKFSSAEIQLKKKLTNWIEVASSIKLKLQIQKYSDNISTHIINLEKFIESEQIESISLSNRIMEAFISETEEKLSNCRDAALKDVCLLACIQLINHYKISMYGTAAALAKVIGMEDQAKIFHEFEVTEKQIDDRLTQLAEHEININAKSLLIS